jgi:hypothetical protein
MQQDINPVLVPSSSHRTERQIHLIIPSLGFKISANIYNPSEAGGPLYTTTICQLISHHFGKKVDIPFLA